jgi:hypothetical protein
LVVQTSSAPGPLSQPARDISPVSFSYQFKDTVHIFVGWC